MRFRLVVHGAWANPGSPLYPYHTGQDGLCTPITAIQLIRAHEWVHISNFQGAWPTYRVNELLEEHVIPGSAADLRNLLADLRNLIQNDHADAFDVNHRMVYPSGCFIDWLSPYSEG